MNEEPQGKNLDMHHGSAGQAPFQQIVLVAIDLPSLSYTVYNVAPQ